MTRRTTNIYNIVSNIKSAAIKYKANLVGRTFLYVFDGRYIEVIFKAVNFKHLTGVESRLGADRFYRYSFKRLLTPSDISFNTDHPFPLCERKVSHINSLADLALGECFMLETITTNTHTYKFGTTDVEFTLLLDEDKDKAGNIRSEKYVVVSLRDEDCFAKSSNAFSVTHILSKPNDVKLYDSVVYCDEKNRYELPDEVVKKINDDLKNNFVKN